MIGCVLTAQQVSPFWTPSHVKPLSPVDGVGAGSETTDESGVRKEGTDIRLN